MSTSATTTETSTIRPRVWLVGGGHTPDPPSNALPAVRDNLGHVWRPGGDGLMHMDTGWHHASWWELRARYDLVEVVATTGLAPVIALHTGVRLKGRDTDQPALTQTVTAPAATQNKGA